jgi:hypothetical protein
VNKKGFLTDDGFSLLEDFVLDAQTHVTVINNNDLYYLRRGHYFGEAEKMARIRIEKK